MGRFRATARGPERARPSRSFYGPERRAIGAFAVADAAGRFEKVLASGADTAEPLTELGKAVALARTAIEAIRRPA